MVIPIISDSGLMVRVRSKFKVIDPSSLDLMKR